MQINIFGGITSKLNIRKRKVKTPLDVHSEQFCQIYVNNEYKSYEAYIQSDKRILSARASMKLNDLNIIARILELIIGKKNPSPYEKGIAKRSNKYHKIFESIPTEDLKELIVNKKESDNPCNNLYKLYHLHDFFYFFQKNKICLDITNAIKTQKQKLKELKIKNPEHWEYEENKILLQLTKDNIKYIIY